MNGPIENICAVTLQVLVLCFSANADSVNGLLTTFCCTLSSSCAKAFLEDHCLVCVSLGEVLQFVRQGPEKNVEEPRDVKV